MFSFSRVIKQRNLWTLYLKNKGKKTLTKPEQSNPNVLQPSPLFPPRHNLTRCSLEKQTNNCPIWGTWNVLVGDYIKHVECWSYMSFNGLIGVSFLFISGTGASTRYRRWLRARCITAQRQQCRGCSRAVDGQDIALKSSGMNPYQWSFIFSNPV